MLFDVFRRSDIWDAFSTASSLSVNMKISPKMSAKTVLLLLATVGSALCQVDHCRAIKLRDVIGPEEADQVSKMIKAYGQFTYSERVFDEENNHVTFRVHIVDDDEKLDELRFPMNANGSLFKLQEETFVKNLLIQRGAIVDPEDPSKFISCGKQTKEEVFQKREKNKKVV